MDQIEHEEMIKKILDSDKNIYTGIPDHTFRGDEKRFENICKRELNNFLYDGLTDVDIFNFEYTFVSDWDNAKPDLFAISKDYKYFSIIEVETTNHPLDRHVIPQMKSLSSANIKALIHPMFKFLTKHNKKFSGYDLDKFVKMVSSIEPEFIVITEKYIEEWELRLSKLDVHYMSLSVYKNEIDEECYNFKRMQKKTRQESILVEWEYNYFKVDINNDVKYFKNDDIIEVKLEGCDDIIKFSISRNRGKIMLFTFGQCLYSSDELCKYTSLLPKGDVYHLLINK